jgi:hypothetical protein
VGGSVVFSIEHAAGRWWTAVNGVRMGYYPDSVWGGVFTQPGLLQAVAEVAAGSDRPCARMGNGAFPTATTGAQISAIGFLPTTTAPVDISTLTPTPSDYLTFKTSGTSMRYGGPGAYPGSPPLGSSCTTLVPYVISLSRTDAAKRVTDAGLVPKFVGGTDGSGEPWVVSQSPGFGAECPVGSTVTMSLKTGRIP